MCRYNTYVDFAKAFDFVSHEKLLYKLKSYGISNKIIKWFYNLYRIDLKLHVLKILFQIVLL